MHRQNRGAFLYRSLHISLRAYLHHHLPRGRRLRLPCLPLQHLWRVCRQSPHIAQVLYGLRSLQRPVRLVTYYRMPLCLPFCSLPCPLPLLLLCGLRRRLEELQYDQLAEWSAFQHPWRRAWRRMPCRWLASLFPFQGLQYFYRIGRGTVDREGRIKPLPVYQPRCL